MTLYSALQKWPSLQPSIKQGILVASDITQEWLLPWWWNHYSRTNHLPVAFVDFGMSSEMKAWCKDKGIYIHLPVADIFVVDKEEVLPSLIQEWEYIYGKHLWGNRSAWFKKPFACLQSPFQTTIWIDIDCEIRDSIQELFSFSKNPDDLAIAREHSGSFNSGVMVFHHGLPLFEEWACRSIKENELHAGDQDVLSKIIEENASPISLLPPIYNWSRCESEDSSAVILHWHGTYGKAIIRHQMMRSQLNPSLFDFKP